MKPYRKLIDLLKKHLGQGGHPKELSMGVTLGVVLGLFPVPGLTTVLGVLAAVALRLNHVVLQAANYAVYPLQIAMLGGYVAMGNLLFGTGISVADLARLPALLGADIFAGARLLAAIIFPGIAAWLLTAPFVGAGVYLLIRPVLFKLRPQPAPAVAQRNGLLRCRHAVCR